MPILQPEKLRAPDAFAALQALAPELIVVAAFGQILRQNVLDLPRYGCINVHASLLPRWRGAAPIQAAVRAGDAESGITIMVMEAGLDTGPMLGALKVPLGADETGESLHDALAAVGGEALLRYLRPFLRGEIVPERQDDALSTYAPMLKREDGLIDWASGAAAVDRQVRAYHPWPGTYTNYQGAVLKVLPAPRGEAAVLPGEAAVGLVVRREGRICVGSGADGALYALGRVQVAGRAAVSAADFANGHPDFIGALLG
jgi:methionyl-tRNA formyltransferase